MIRDKLPLVRAAAVRQVDARFTGRSELYTHAPRPTRDDLRRSFNLPCPFIRFALRATALIQAPPHPRTGPQAAFLQWLTEPIRRIGANWLRRAGECLATAGATSGVAGITATIRIAPWLHRWIARRVAVIWTGKAAASASGRFDPGLPARRAAVPDIVMPRHRPWLQCEANPRQSLLHR